MRRYNSFFYKRNKLIVATAIIYSIMFIALVTFIVAQFQTIIANSFLTIAFMLMVPYTLLMLFAFRRKSSLLMLLAGVALWRPLALTWSCICGHESYSWLPLPLAFLVLPPLGMAYAYAGKNRDFASCIIYLLALLPALYFLR